VFVIGVGPRRLDPTYADSTAAGQRAAEPTPMLDFLCGKAGK
jgi:hypothetical protein